MFPFDTSGHTSSASFSSTFKSPPRTVGTVESDVRDSGIIVEFKV